MSRKVYPQNNINPEFVDENLVMHLNAARPIKEGWEEGADEDHTVFWRDWSRKQAAFNSPTVIWNDLKNNAINAKLNHFGAPKQVWSKDAIAFGGGGSDFIEVTDNGMEQFAHQEFTIEVWAKAVVGGNRVLFAYEHEDGTSCAHLRLANDKLYFGFNTHGTSAAIMGSLPEDFDERKINQFVCTFKSGGDGQPAKARIYINKQELKTEGEKNVTGHIKYTKTPVYIGKSSREGNAAMFKGEITNVLYYKSALSEAEITQNYFAGTGEIALPAAYINVKDYGAKGDGVTDDTAAIQCALDAAANYVIGSDAETVKDDKGKDMLDKDGNPIYLREEALPKQAAGAGNVYIPPGIYMIDANKAVEMRSNTNLYMHGKTILQAIPNSLLFYTILGIRKVENIGVYGGNIRGERNEHKGTQGQWGFGMSIINSRNVTVEGTRADECWADGFFIGNDTYYTPVAAAREKCSAPEDIRLIDVKADRNRRQGISLVSGRNIDMIRPLLSNTGGFGDPEAGIDIEPDDSRHVIENIHIQDAVTKNNSGAGILFYLHNLLWFRYEKEPRNREVSITVIGHHDIGSAHGVFFQDRGLFVKDDKKAAVMESAQKVDAEGNPMSDAEGNPIMELTQMKNGATVTGFVTFEDCIWEKARDKSLCIADHLAHIPEEYPNRLARNVNIEERPPQVYQIKATNCTFKNVGQDTSGPLLIRNMTTQGSMGNILLEEPVFCDDTGRDKSKIQNIYHVPPFPEQMYGIKIHNPKYKGGYEGYKDREPLHAKVYITHDEEEKNQA